MDIVAYLINEHNVNINIGDTYGWTALMYAIYHGKLLLVQYLVEEGHADITHTTNNGKNVFDFACTTNHHNDVVVYLLQVLKRHASDK
jgi:ankyrin repeat protein